MIRRIRAYLDHLAERITRFEVGAWMGTDDRDDDQGGDR